VAPAPIIKLTPEFPDPLQVLFEPRRYKVLYGGRGAGRSWGVARALLMLGTQRPIRVLCCRELQKSISESVHKVLSDQIVALGLESLYDIEVAKIKGKNGTTFSFEGIKNNATAIKSYEGIDYCWVEEANKVSKTSWGILTPTIRKEIPKDWRELGMERPEFEAEIWMTFNPELETDYTYSNWVKDKRLKPVSHLGSAGQIWTSQESRDSVVVKMTHKDNPWFPEVLKRELEAEREKDYDNYLNVWEGFTVVQLEGTVFKKELRQARETGRIGEVPWEREVPVDCFWDLGRANHTCIWFGQFVSMQFRVVDFLDGQGEDITYYLKELQNRGYVYGTMFLPHDAKHKKLVYKHSIEKIVRDKYPDTRIVPKTSIQDGINMARLFFPKCHFDELACADGLSMLSRYKYKVVDGQITNDPVHDDEGVCDAADAFKYMAQAASLPRGKRDVLQKLGLPPSALGEDKAREFARRSLTSGLDWMG
jgi:phage terminase large subunit